LCWGSCSSLPDGYHEKGNVSYHILGSILECINVRLGEFYTKGEIYTGGLVVNEEFFAMSSQFQPETITHKFSNQTDYWDDGVEVNYQFKLKTLILNLAGIGLLIN